MHVNVYLCKLAINFQKGDDAVIYCHPYMDPRIKYANESDDAADNKYPDEIGISINKYFTPTSGQQAYDAEWVSKLSHLKIE